MASKWTDFLGDVEAESREKNHKVCAMCLLLDGLTPAARDSIQKAMDRPELSAPAIRRALAKRLDTTPPSDFIIRRHRRGECSGG